MDMKKESYQAIDKPLEISKPEEKKGKYIPFVQSANVLFKFMSKIDYLKEVIVNRAIIPRYYEEKIDYLEMSIKSIAFPMICFCDINLQKLLSHTEFYGYYGIGLDKKWGIDQGIQPIHYINKVSSLKQDFSYLFSKSLNSLEQESEIIRNYNNYLLTNLLFMKPIDGEMFRNGEYVQKNFHDEREWRYIPDMNNESTDLPQLIPKEQMNYAAYKLYSDGLRENDYLWLKFEYGFIKYLVVKTFEDRLELINFINQNIKLGDIDKSLLIAKILIFDEMKEDW